MLRAADTDASPPGPITRVAEEMPPLPAKGDSLRVATLDVWGHFADWPRSRTLSLRICRRVRSTSGPTSLASPPQLRRHNSRPCLVKPSSTSAHDTTAITKKARPIPSSNASCSACPRVRLATAYMPSGKTKLQRLAS
jgi:hypothetical protein